MPERTPTRPVQSREHRCVRHRSVVGGSAAGFAAGDVVGLAVGVVMPLRGWPSGYLFKFGVSRVSFAVGFAVCADWDGDEVSSGASVVPSSIQSQSAARYSQPGVAWQVGGWMMSPQSLGRHRCVLESRTHCPCCGSLRQADGCCPQSVAADVRAARTAMARMTSTGAPMF